MCDRWGPVPLGGRAGAVAELLRRRGPRPALRRVRGLPPGRRRRSRRPSRGATRAARDPRARASVSITRAWLHYIGQLTFRSECRANARNAGELLPRSGQDRSASPECCRIWADVGRKCAETGRIWTKITLVRHPPTSTKIGPEPVTSGSVSAKIRPISPDVDSRSAKFGETWPEWAKSGPTSDNTAQIQPTLAGLGQSLGRSWPNLARL